MSLDVKVAEINAMSDEQKLNFLSNLDTGNILDMFAVGQIYPKLSVKSICSNFVDTIRSKSREISGLKTEIKILRGQLGTQRSGKCEKELQEMEGRISKLQINLDQARSGMRKEAEKMFAATHGYKKGLPLSVEEGEDDDGGEAGGEARGDAGGATGMGGGKRRTKRRRTKRRRTKRRRTKRRRTKRRRTKKS